MEPVVQRRPKGRGWILLGAVFTIVGLVAGIVCLVMFVRPFFDTFTAPILGAPGQHVLDLEQGEYDIFARTGVRETTTPVDPDDYGDIEITVEIIGPDGSAVILRSSDSSSVERGDTDYESIHVAEVTEDGEHVVRFTTEDNDATELIVSRTVFQTARDGWLWLVGGIVSAVLLMAGVALIGGGWFTLNRQKKEAMLAAESGAVRSRNELLSDAWTEPSRFQGAPTPPPPSPERPAATPPQRQFPEAGWYPDPDDPDRGYRWWMGRTWSDQTRER